MTKWGKVLRFFGCASDREQELILSRINQFSADSRQWDYRHKKEQEEAQRWVLLKDNEIEAQCVQLLQDFKRTRLHRVYGWNMTITIIAAARHHISLYFWSGDVDAGYLITVWLYDLDAIIKACDGRAGLNNDELNWMMREAMKAAKEIKANKSI